MRIVKITSGAKYRMYEQFQILSFFGISDSFPNWENSENFFTFQHGKF